MFCARLKQSIFYPKKHCYTFLEKPILNSKKKFLIPPKNQIFKRKKNFLHSLERADFLTKEKFLMLKWKSDFSHSKKKLLIFPWQKFINLSEKVKLSKQRKFFITIRKKTIFQTKNLLRLPEKLIFHTCAKHFCIPDSCCLGHLQSVMGHLGLALVFMWGSALREKFNLYSSRVFCLH